MMQLDEVMVL